VVLEEGGRLCTLGIRDMGPGLGLAVEGSSDDPSNIRVEDHSRHPERESLYRRCGVLADTGKRAQLLGRPWDLSLVLISDDDR
jgi:hypothetical protein